MTIDPGQPIPLYFQLKTLLLEAIARGEYAPGDRLPTEYELCARYALSRTPVNRALSELAAAGVILRRRRHGSFVNPHWAPRRGVELRVIVPEEGPWEQHVRKAVPDDLTVNLVTVPRADLHHALTSAVAEGVAPDLALLDSVWMPEFAVAGFLRPLEELDAEWVRDEHGGDFHPSLVRANRYDGRTYAVSASADISGIWYRIDELARRGLAVPSTWTQLRRVLRALRDAGVSHPIVMPAGSRGDETTSYSLLALLASNGAHVLADGRVTLDDRRTVQALAFLRGLVDDDLLPADAVGYEWDRARRLLGRGQAAMSFGGSYEAVALAGDLGVAVGDLHEHLGFVTVPHGPRGTAVGLVGTMVCGIFRQAAHPDLAMRLLRHIAAPEPLAAVGVATARIPPRRSALAMAAPALPLLRATADVLADAVARPATPLYPRVSAQLQAMLEAVLTGRLTPTRATRRAAELISAITNLPLA